MRESTRPTSSLWMETAEIRARKPLQQDTQADVCIVGAGIGGLTTGYLLSYEGLSVVVLEEGSSNSGETSRTTAHLSNALDDGFVELERLHGESGARLAAQSHTAAIDRIQAIIAKERIQCDFERLDGYLFDPPGDPTGILEKELDAARRAGLKEVQMVERAPLASFNTGPCLRFPRQGQFHPLKYLSSLMQAIERNGGRIFHKTKAEEFKNEGKVQVVTSGGPVVTADALVVATNTPVNDWVAIHTKQAAYRSYVVAAPVPRGAMPTALLWDTLDPYHYVRLQRGSHEDLLIVGGEDHKTGQVDDVAEPFGRLEAWMRQRFPMAGPAVSQWSGQIMEPVDGLAFLGRNPGEKNVYIVTGDSGHGMTHGTIGGMLISDLILGRSNPWEALYDPSRVSLKSASEFAKENLNVVAQYGEYVTGGQVASSEEIPAGEGALLRRGLKKIAVYRDEEGELHELSAICPHLGCIVAWNPTEKTWDCPCHGSRFEATGKVINGPAITDLAAAEPVGEAGVSSRA